MALSAAFAQAPAAVADVPAPPAPETSKPETPKITQSDGVSHFELANGLKVVVIPDHRAPVVTQMIWYHVGSADEEAGKSGIAHFLEHLMFKGTITHPAGEFSARVGEIGGLENAFTSYDYTAYFQRVAPDALEMVMGFESDRMQNLVLTDEVVKTERDVILEERRMRIESNPAAMLNENAQATLFYNHPYRTPVIGWRQEMEKLGLDDAVAFYKRYYTPNNATLVIAGDVTPEHVLELVQKTWAKVPRRAEPGVRDRPQEPIKHAERLVTLHDERITQPSFRITWLTPSYANEARFSNAKSGDAAALDLLGEILGGSVRSRLYQNLIVKKGMASSAGASYDGDAFDDGSFSVFGSPRGEATLGELEQAIKDEVARVIKDGITENELQQARNRFLKAVIFARDSQSGMARIYGSTLSSGQTIEEIQGWPDRIRKVTVDEIKDAAKRYLKPGQSVTSYLLPPDVEARAARQIGNGGGPSVGGSQGAVE